MNAVAEQRRWLTLSAASEFLGVDPSTLRAWTDAGRIRAFRTPGGHRRYALEDLRAFVQRGRRPQTAGPISDLVNRHGTRLITASRRRVRAQEWFAAFDEHTAEAMRTTCRRLMNGLSGYLQGGRRQGAYLREGEQAGRAMGIRLAAVGLTPAAATRAFLFFRQIVTDAVSKELPLPAERKVQSIRRVDVFLNRVMQQVMDVYERKRQQRDRTHP